MIYNKKKFNIEYNAKIIYPQNNEVKIWLAEPLNDKLQKINKTIINVKPNKSYKDSQGNKILYFKFKNHGKIDIKLITETILWKEKIDLKKISFRNIPNSVSKRYTKNERFLEQTLSVKKELLDITKDKKTDLEKIESIFNFVMKNFKYCYPVKKRGVKNLDLKKLRGDCGEYSSLFVSMCRILGIPARNNTGFVIFSKQGKISEHGWASVYVKSYGWIDMDPQYGSLEKNLTMAKNKYFGQRKEYRLSFINGFNIPIEPVLSKQFKANYWRKIGLPLEKNTVQILQPLIFASKKPIKFQDNIKLIN